MHERFSVCLVRYNCRYQSTWNCKLRLCRGLKLLILKQQKRGCKKPIKSTSQVLQDLSKLTSPR